MALNTHDVRRTGTNRRYTIGAADSTVSFMFLIAWTAARVVKVQITKDFKLTSYKVSNIRGQYTILEVKQITVKAGQTLYFTKSGMDKMYYLTSESGCTCKAGRMKQVCHHVEDVTAFVARREEREVVTSEVTTCKTETLARAFETGTTVYHVGKEVVAWEPLFQAWGCTCRESPTGMSYSPCQHTEAVIRSLDTEKSAA